MIFWAQQRTTRTTRLMTDALKEVIRFSLVAEDNAALRREALFESVGNGRQGAVWDGFRRAIQMGIKIVTNAESRVNALDSVKFELSRVELQNLDDVHPTMDKSIRPMFILGQQLGYQYVLALVTAT